jgi:hypothetical protein
VAPIPAAVIVERPDVAVMFKRVADELGAINCGWSEVEQAVAPLRGRKFYGACDPASEEYRVCVQVREADDPSALGLEAGTLPGGCYARVRLNGEPPDVYQMIGPTFEKLAQRPDCDPTRPLIEFYRRRDLIDLLQPIA